MEGARKSSGKAVEGAVEGQGKGGLHQRETNKKTRAAHYIAIESDTRHQRANQAQQLFERHERQGFPPQRCSGRQREQGRAWRSGAFTRP